MERVLVLGAAGCVVLVILATLFGHALTPAKSLGPDEAIGTVLFVESSSHFVEASYVSQGASGQQGLATRYSNDVTPGQTVVVRYDPGQASEGTVLSEPTPKRGPNGLYGVFVGILGFIALGVLWVGGLCRNWRIPRAREADTDYRTGPWAGTTNSA